MERFTINNNKSEEMTVLEVGVLLVLSALFLWTLF